MTPATLTGVLYMHITPAVPSISSRPSLVHSTSSSPSGVFARSSGCEPAACLSSAAGSGWFESDSFSLPSFSLAPSFCGPFLAGSRCG